MNQLLKYKITFFEIVFIIPAVAGVCLPPATRTKSLSNHSLLPNIPLQSQKEKYSPILTPKVR